jgi:ABC-type branched-subunit amino acid transport system ATPase component
LTRVLEVEQVTGGYGKLSIVFDASLYVDEGEILAIVGPNGSGKSTLVKIIAGVATIQRGKILLGGEDITLEPPEKRISRGLGYLPQVGNIFPDLTVRENLELGGYGLGKRAIEYRIEEILSLFPELRSRMTQRAGTLSGGERQMLALSRALMKNPRILLLDEPSAGLAPKLVERIFSSIKSLIDIGKSIVLVEQHAKRALELADRGIVMASGRIVMEGTARDLLRSEDLRLAFLGKK